MKKTKVMILISDVTSNTFFKKINLKNNFFNFLFKLICIRIDKKNKQIKLINYSAL